MGVKNKHINENGYPLNPSLINRGGQNRYNYGFEYKIVPLNTSLSQKGNDKDAVQQWKEHYKDKLYISKRVEGKGAVDKKNHTGRICSFSYKDDSGLKIKWIWIFDEETMKKVALIPNTVEIVEDVYKPYAQRMNPFSTNMGHLRENDVDGEYLSPEVKKWRDLLIDELSLNKNIVTYMDDKFIYNQFDSNVIQLSVFNKNDFFYLLGLDENDSQDEIRKMLNRFLSMFCLMRDVHIGKMKIEVKKHDIIFTDENGELSEDFIIASWMDIFAFVISILFCLNRKDDSSMVIPQRQKYRNVLKYMIESLVPFVDIDDKGERIFIER